MHKMIAMFMVIAIAAVVAAAATANLTVLQEPTSSERTVKLTEIETQAGPAKIWVCNDEGCPEGCTSKGDDVFGIGLLLKESEELKAE